MENDSLFVTFTAFGKKSSNLILGEHVYLFSRGKGN